MVKHIFPGITILSFSQTCKVLEQALQKSRRLSWIYKFCGTQSNFVEPLQAFNWLGNGHLQALIDFAVVKTCSTIIVRHSTGFIVIKICILFRYSHSIAFAVIKTGLLNPYSPWTGNAVLKTVLLILYRLSKQAIYYRLSTILPVVKMCLVNIYRHPTGFAVVKTGFLKIEVFNWLCDSQNWFVHLLKAFNKLELDCLTSAGLLQICSSENGFTTAPLIFNRVCCTQICLAKLLQASKIRWPWRSRYATMSMRRWRCDDGRWRCDDRRWRCDERR